MRLEDIELEEGEQPDSMEFALADGIFIKSGHFRLAGAVVPQHSHEHDHTSFIATGAVLVWCDGDYLGEYRAPCQILIKAHTKHTFRTLEDNTLILCIHNISRTGDIEIHDLHELSFP